MITIEVQETGPGILVELTTRQAAELDRSNLVTVRLGDGGGWQVSGAGRVGVATVGDMVVRVRPKVSIARVFYLLGYGRGFSWRDDLVPYDTESDLVHVIAESFARQADRALGRGVVHGYVEYDDELAVVRGRLRMTEQLTRRYGQITPLLVRYDEFTPDIAENQLLKAAARVLLRVPGLSPAVARHLRVVTDRLAGVSDLRAGAPLPTWWRTRRNTHYETALWFAEMVLRYRSVDLPDGPMEINGFMVDMAKVFEDFVEAAFSAALERIDGHVEAQAQHTLDEAGQVKMNPDLVWHRGGGPAAVIDAKYKAEKPAGYPNADIYQLLAYCTALGLPEGHLIYAKGAEDPAVHLVRNGGVRIVAHALDLEVTPEALLAQTQQIAALIAEPPSPKLTEHR
jgi:5-methylcytosine-specific restriction enzyme subunit McrC